MNDARTLKFVDDELLIHKQAWANHQAKAEKNIGTKKEPKIVPYFKDFTQFYDYEEQLNKALGKVEVPTVERDDKLLELFNAMNA